MKHIKIIENNLTMDLLEKTCQHVSVESYADGVGLEFFSENFTKIASSIASVTSQSFNKVTSLVTVPFVFDFNFESKVKNLNFAAIDTLKITVPEGFAGSALAYCQVLIETMEHSNNLIGNVINPFNQYISNLISDKSFQSAYQSVPHHLIVSNQKRDNLNKETAKFFKPRTTSYGKVSEFYHSSDEIALTDQKISEISKLLEATKPIDVRKTINDSVELVNAFQKMIDSGQVTGISPSNMRVLSETCLAIAKEIEFYSVARYRADSFINCFKQSRDQIKKVM